MSITPSFLKKLFSVLIIAIFSVSLLFVGFTNLQSKEAKAFDVLSYLNKCGNSIYSSCDLLSEAITCTIDPCSDGVNPDTIVKNCMNGYYRYNSKPCLSLYSSTPYLNCYNSGYSNYPCNNNIYPINYSYNNYNGYNNCVNCFEQAINQLQNGVNNYNLGNATVSQDLLNNITNSGRSDIPTSVVSYVSGNTAYTEVKNYDGTVLSSTGFSIDERGNTSVNNSNFSSTSPNCSRNINLYVCKSFSTIQVANQFGTYGSISVPFESTFTIAPTQNYNNYNNYNNNIAYNYPIYNDYPIYDNNYYYGLEDCNNSLFGCGY
jgi:hypothetical protein